MIPDETLTAILEARIPRDCEIIRAGTFSRTCRVYSATYGLYITDVIDGAVADGITLACNNAAELVREVIRLRAALTPPDPGNFERNLAEATAGIDAKYYAGWGAPVAINMTHTIPAEEFRDLWEAYRIEAMKSHATYERDRLTNFLLSHAPALLALVEAEGKCWELLAAMCDNVEEMANRPYTAAVSFLTIVDAFRLLLPPPPKDIQDER